MVGVLAFYSDVPSSNPSLKTTDFPVKFVFEKNENKHKEAGVEPYLKNCEKVNQAEVVALKLLSTSSAEYFVKQKMSQQKFEPKLNYSESRKTHF